MERNPNSLDIEKLGLAVLPAFKNEVELYTNNKGSILNLHTKAEDINNILEQVLLKEAISFFDRKGVIPIFIEGPNKNDLFFSESDEPYISQKISLEEVLKDKEYVRRFYQGDESLIDYAYNQNYGLLNGNRVSTNGTHLISAYFKSDKLNVNVKGERRTIPQITDDNIINRNIYIFGSCLTFGLFTDDEHTFPSILQQLICQSSNSHQTVHNFGVKGRNCLLNDLLFALNNPLRKGDIAIFACLFSDTCRQIIENAICNRIKLKVYNFSAYLNAHTLPKHCFLNSSFHCNQVIYKELANYTKEIIQTIPMPDMIDDTIHVELSLSYLQETKKSSLIDTDRLLDELFIKDLLQRVQQQAFHHKDGQIIGSLVMAANPFTNGHAQLVDYVARECDYFYIFIIEDSHFDFPFVMRFAMAQKYASKYSHCRVIPTGNYFGADFLFPEYHDRVQYNKTKITSPQIDTIIFARHLAPCLGINRRYLGSEETDPVTQQFNEYLQSFLPRYGIDVVVVPRFNTPNNNIISGSYVRGLLKSFPESEELINYLPQSSIDVINQGKNFK